jgi:hypothetical protein
VSEFDTYLKKRIEPINPKRYGWYIQQLIKLEYCFQARSEDRILIWDADTIPLRLPEVFSGDGAVFPYTDSSIHYPYRDNIRRLLDIEPPGEYSFVAQCFPIHGRWATALRAELEWKHKARWWKSIIDSIDFSENSGFSEYELLGSFVTQRFGGLVKPNPGKWERNGWNIFSQVSDVRFGSLRESADPDFVAFENWQHRDVQG